MKRYLSFEKMVLVLALTAVMICFFAFRQKSKSGGYSFRKEQSTPDNDTTTSGKRNRDGAGRDFYKIEEQMSRLERQMEKLEDQMQKLDKEIQKIDMTKYQDELDEALKNMNDQNVPEMDELINNIDREKVSKSIEHAKENRLQLRDVEKQLKKAVENLHRQNIELKLNNVEIRAEAERAMNNARQSMESAREEIKNVKAFTDALEKDGLIDKSKAYRIEVKNGELFIDGKKQSKEVSDKYRRYYKKGDFSIDMSEGDDFRI
jgi:chromosome segregation ATPase